MASWTLDSEGSPRNSSPLGRGSCFARSCRASSSPLRGARAIHLECAGAFVFVAFSPGRSSHVRDRPGGCATRLRPGEYRVTQRCLRRGLFHSGRTEPHRSLRGVESRCGTHALLELEGKWAEGITGWSSLGYAIHHRITSIEHHGRPP